MNKSKLNTYFFTQEEHRIAIEFRTVVTDNFLGFLRRVISWLRKRAICRPLIETVDDYSLKMRQTASVCFYNRFSQILRDITNLPEIT
jgi:hypothetical protein